MKIDTEINSLSSRYALSALFEGSALRGKAVSMDRAAEISQEFKALSIDQRRKIVRSLIAITVKPGRDPEERVVIIRRAAGSEGAGA